MPWKFCKLICKPRSLLSCLKLNWNIHIVTEQNQATSMDIKLFAMNAKFLLQIPLK